MKPFEFIAAMETLFEKLEQREKIMVLVLFPLVFGAITAFFLIPQGQYYFQDRQISIQERITQHDKLSLQLDHEKMGIAPSPLIDHYTTLQHKQLSLSKTIATSLALYCADKTDPPSILLKTLIVNKLELDTLTEKKSEDLHPLLRYRTWEIKLYGQYENIVTFLNTITSTHPRFIITSLTLEKKEAHLTLVCTLSHVGFHENF